MPTYIVPAEGTYDTREFTAGSAFSRGDMLTLNSSSQVSKLASALPSGAIIAGFALADSTKSINGKVTVAVPHSETVFWSTCTPGSTFTRGANVNFNYGSAWSTMIANGSTGTTPAVCVKGVDDIEGQSVESRIQVRFKDANLLFTV